MEEKKRGGKRENSGRKPFPFTFEKTEVRHPIGSRSEVKKFCIELFKQKKCKENTKTLMKLSELKKK